MTYKVSTPLEHFTSGDPAKAVGALVEEWIDTAKSLADAADDEVSQRYRLAQDASGRVAAIPKWDGGALTGLVAEVRAAAQHVVDSDAGLADRVRPVVRALDEGMRPGIPQRPAIAPAGDDLDAWDLLHDALSRQFTSLHGLLREQASTLAKMDSASKVLGQLSIRRDETEKMLLLTRQGEKQVLAIALADTGAVYELVTWPQQLADGTPGAGGALMEYLVRRALAARRPISLIPLDSSASRIYTKWGFKGNDSGMNLALVDMPAFLAHRTAFAHLAF
jgi:hypothetical protein